MPYGPSSTIGSCIMSALSIPPSQKTNISVGQESIHNYANVLNPVALVGADQYSVVAVYTEVEVGASEVDEEMIESAEVQVQTDFYEEEIVAVSADIVGNEESTSLKAEETSETVDVAKALETLTKTFALRKECIGPDVLTGKINDSNNESIVNDEAAFGNTTNEEKTLEGLETSNQTDEERKNIVEDVQEDFQHECTESNLNSCTELKDNYETFSVCEEMTDVSNELSETQASASSAHVRRSSRLQMKTSPSWQETCDSDEMTSIIFTCSQCPFHNYEENSPPHFHMQSVPTKVYKTLSGAKFTPSPSSTDEIFTSIKLFPKGNTEQSKTEQPDNQNIKVNVPQSHSRQKALTCETCGKTFTRTSDVRRHQLTHTGERPFHCSQCDRTFQHSWDLAKHESKHHNVAISFSCQLCRSSFTNLRALTVHHKKSHSQESQLPQICSICSLSFATPSELLEHRRSHVTSKRYLCQQCGEGFDSLLARSQHRQMHQGELSKHHRSHVDDRPYSCPQCDKRFKSKKTQQEHIVSHTGARPYPCSYCGKGFTKPYALTRHNLIHTGERPFPCGHCGKTFLTLSEAQLHQRIHTGERPYPCNTCELKFKSSSELARHKRSHSGLKPLKPYCKRCMKTFTSKAKLKKHMETHNEEEEAAQSLDSIQSEEYNN
ncbi:hypothetical protein PAMP_015120 [Pampus punctatissimus]